jgi:hypothetical protein
VNTFDTYRQDLSVSSDGPLSFRRRDGYWFLDLNGLPLYEIGYRCETCQGVFERSGVRSLTLTPTELRDKLERGLGTVSQDVVDTVSALLPRGTYKVALLEVTPVLSVRPPTPPSISHLTQLVHLWGPPPGPPIFWNGPDYFWLGGFHSTLTTAGYEIVLPLVPRSHIDSSRVRSYSDTPRSGLLPTALALSVLDSCNPQGRGILVEGLVHFLLDGHHKVMAASNSREPIRLLSFLAYKPPREPVRFWRDNA